MRQNRAKSLRRHGEQSQTQNLRKWNKLNVIYQWQLRKRERKINDMGNGSREMPKKRGEGARGNVFVQTDTIQVKRTSR